MQVLVQKIALWWETWDTYKKRGTLFIQNYLSKNQLKNYLGVAFYKINYLINEAILKTLKTDPLIMK